jgi:hypothetical protein
MDETCPTLNPRKLTGAPTDNPWTEWSKKVTQFKVGWKAEESPKKITPATNNEKAEMVNSPILK